MRKRLQAFVAALLAGSLFLPGCGHRIGSERMARQPTAAPTLDDYPPLPAAPSPGASPAMHALARQFASGINFGNMLDAPNEGDWGLRVEDDFIALVGRDGFTRSVRLPVRWSNHAGVDAAAAIDPAFFARVDSVVDALLARGATVLLDMHHYRQLDGDALDPDERAVDPALLRVRLLSMWRQIAERYAHRSPRLVFEIYNEPHGTLEPHWNDLLSRAVRVIRASNPTRAIVVGPTQWNAPARLAQLVLPADPHLILTVHQYEPFEFTHQGAEWVTRPPPVGTDCCDAQQRQRIADALDTAVMHAARLGYPVFVGEFGAYDKAPHAARLRYLAFMREAMQSRRLSWFHWDLASGFGLFDPLTRRFRTDLRDTLYAPAPTRSLLWHQH